MSARENESQISQNYILHLKFSEFHLCFHNSCKIWHSFSRTPVRNFLWCYYRWLITSLALEKCKKECNAPYIILVQGFCPLKIEITQFPGGFRLKALEALTNIARQANRILNQYDSGTSKISVPDIYIIYNSNGPRVHKTQTSRPPFVRQVHRKM